MRVGAVAFGTLALGSTSLLTGCSTASEASSAISSSSSDGVRSASHFVADMSDYETEVPNNLTMIATIWTPANAVVCMLGQEEKLCGTTPEFKDNAWANYVFPEVADVPTIIEDGKCDINEMVEIDPCVVFAEASQQSDIDDIRDADLRAMNAGFDDFTTMKESIFMVADTIGGNASEIAEKWLNLLEANIDLVSNKLANVDSQNRTSVMHVVKEDGKLMASGNAGFVADWMEFGGAMNAIDSTESKVEITPDLLEEANPSVVIVGGDDAPEVVKEILADSEWANVPAVASLNVVPNPKGVSSWDGPGPEAALQVLWVANQLYPEAIDHLEMIDYVRDFYEDFYKFRISKCDAVSVMDCVQPVTTSDCDEKDEAEQAELASQNEANQQNEDV